MNYKAIFFIVLSLLMSCTSSNKNDIHNEFEFVVLGDTWYQLEKMDEYYELIDLVNKKKPSFSVHIGDTRGSTDTPCTNDHYQLIYESFMRFENPLIYTPGDNEWTDCWEPNELNPSAGYFKPEERLKQLRQVFFKDDKSLGKKSLKLVRQSEIDADHSVYVENRQWMYGDVLFFTMNIPGSNNGWVLGSDSLDSEFNNRQSANIAWLRRSFKVADSLNAQAVVMFYHADLNPVYPKNYPELRPLKFRRHQLGTVDGFEDIRTEIRKYSESFSGQVLQVYGDSHQFTFTQPYQGVQNVWRLQTFGYPDHKAVVVKVNSSKPWCFEAVPLFK